MRRIIVCALLTMVLVASASVPVNAQTLTNAEIQQVIRNLISVVEDLHVRLAEQQGIFALTNPNKPRVTERISAPDIIITSPRNKAIWEKGVRYAIQWSMSNVKKPEIRIINRETGRVAYTNTLGTDTTRFVWEVPSSLDTGTYTIQVSGTHRRSGDTYMSQSAVVRIQEPIMLSDSGFDIAF